MKDLQTRTFKYTSDLQKRIHQHLLEIKKFYFTRQKFIDDRSGILKENFQTHENCDYITNLYVWDTFFKYDEEILKYLIAKAKELSKNKHTIQNNVLQYIDKDSKKEVIDSEIKKLSLIEFFSICMLVSPKDAPHQQPKTEKKLEVNSLSLESLLEGVGEED